MTRQEVYAFCRREEDAPFHGWEFLYASRDVRMQTDPLPWDYREKVLTYLTKEKNALLDMGTGDGKFLDDLPRLPYHAHATEGYPPHIDLARRRLGVKGVVVHPIEEGAPLPFKERYFDIALNRHEAFNAQEVFRVTRPGGHFVTQQVRGDDSLALNRHLEIKHPGTYLRWNLQAALEGLIKAGFTILDFGEAEPEQRFYDVGAVVYFARQIPWQFPGFSVERNFEALYDLHRLIETQGVLKTHAPRFFVVAERPAT